MDDLVTLGAYADQIREHIHNDRNDEALAICKHILHYYPKAIDVYRLMGQACLQKGLLEDAKELFQRVLSADPENIVAYAGLADVCEQQHLIAEAVWQMERAFELSPGNVELRKELLRLHTEFDGKAHPRLKLTSVALARLYNAEGLYAQAVQELQTVTASAPTRYDARVALAEILWHMGRMHEAAEIAQALLTTLPYCLKANLILGIAWKEAGIPEAEQYLERATALDPANVLAQQLLGASSILPLINATVPRYVKPAPPVAAVEKEPSVVSATLPETASTEISAPTEMSESPKPQIADTTLPPWLLGSIESPLTELPSFLEQESPTPIEPISETTEPEIESESGEESLPDWLRDTASVLPAEPPEPSAEVTPSWLNDLQATSTVPAESPVAEEPPSVAPESPVETTPSWLSDLQAASTPSDESPITEESAVAPEESQNWLSDFERASAPSPETNPPAEPSAANEALVYPLASPEKVEAALDLLRDLKAEPAAEIESVEPESATPTPPAPAAPPAFVVEPALVAQWMRDLQAQTLVTPEEPESQAQTGAVESPVPTPIAPVALGITQAQPVASQPVATSPVVVEPVAETRATKAKRPVKGAEHLVQARAHRDANRLSEALVEYDYVVQHAPGLVKEVIADLEALTNRIDAPLEAHRVLGDAYTRTDRLNQALERYRFVLDHTNK